MHVALQFLREHALQVFSPPGPAVEDLHHFLWHLKQINPYDLGLSERIIGMNRDLGWDFEDLMSHELVHIKMLMIPKGKQIPLHDHPGMHVFLKNVWGHMRVEAYDWIEKSGDEGYVVKTLDQVVNGASEPCLIGPEHHNLHCITAIDDCAFIDVCSPFYDEENGRPCTYYDLYEIEGEERPIFRISKKKNF